MHQAILISVERHQVYINKCHEAGDPKGQSIHYTHISVSGSRISMLRRTMILPDYLYGYRDLLAICNLDNQLGDPICG